MKNLFLFSLLVLSLSVFTSCEKEPEVQNPTGLAAPALPTATMFTMPTETIDDSEQTDVPAGVTYQNWWHAGVNLAVWNTVAVVSVALPLQAIGAAFNQDAQFIGNNTYEWRYQHNATAAEGGGTYDISLTGEYSSDAQEVYWELNASKAGEFSDFTWVSGRTSTNQHLSEFILSKNPNNGVQALKINFEQQNNDNATLRFTNIDASDANNGHFIEYRTDADGEFNRAFDLQGVPGNLLEIRWNEPARDGKVKHPTHFGDNNWHCWNDMKYDIDCQ